MPCRSRAVKKNPAQQINPTRSLGAVDLHIHGAFGIDLFSAPVSQLNELAHLLWEKGVAAFCPTTLTASRDELLEAVRRIGNWTSQVHEKRSSARGALPLGIHLEGPFIHSEARGAHPTSWIRPLQWEELESLWEASRGTLKIITLAPETLTSPLLRKLGNWASERHIILSIGHSRATETQAEFAIQNANFSGITHAWNALSFHHRSPGPLGAALGNPDVHLEVIPDGIHVDQTVVRWMCRLHAPSPVCFVSDCAPAAETLRKWCSFGPLQTRFSKGACRLSDGTLAGGGHVLTETYSRWVRREAIAMGLSESEIFSASLRFITEDPLRALKLQEKRVLNALKRQRIRWNFESKRGYWATPCRNPIDWEK